MSDALGGRRWAWIHLCKHPITDPLRYQRVDEREVLGHLLKVITYSWATIYCTSWQEENRMLWDRDDWGRSSSCVIIEQIFFYESCVTWAMFLMNGLYWQVWEGKCSLIQRIVQWRLMWICFPKYTQMKSSTYLTNADRAIHGMYHMAYGLDVLGELVQCYPENSAVKTDHGSASPNTLLPISLGLGVFAIIIFLRSLPRASWHYCSVMLLL